jgi:hypothetical protein
MRHASFEDLISLAIFAGLAAMEKIFVAAAALRAAKTLLEEAIGERYAIVGRE